MPAISLPPPDTNFTGCLGISYTLLPVTIYTATYDFETKSIKENFNINIVIPEFTIYLPLNKFLNKYPVFDNNCEKMNDDLVFPGVPCDLTTCRRRVCTRIFRRRICTNVPYPCPRFTGQVYLVDDEFKNTKLLTIPELGFRMNAGCEINSKWSVSVISNSAATSWIDFLITMFGSQHAVGITSNKDVFDKLLITLKETVGSVINKMMVYFATKKMKLFLSVKFTKIIFDLTLNIDYLKLNTGNQEVELKNLSYTIKDVNILTLAGGESLEFTVDNSARFVIDYVIGTYDIGILNIFTMLATMIQNQINILKAIPGYENIPNLKEQVRNLEVGLEYMKNLEKLINFIPGFNVNSIPYLDTFLKNFQPKLQVRLRLCPLSGLMAMCGTLIFDISKYILKLLEFLQNNYPRLSKYNEILDSQLVGRVPVLNQWNQLMQKANEEIDKIAKAALDGNAEKIADGIKSFYMGAIVCVPM